MQVIFQFIVEWISDVLARRIYGTKDVPRPRWRRSLFRGILFALTAIACIVMAQQSVTDGIKAAVFLPWFFLALTGIGGEGYYGSEPLAYVFTACVPLPIIALFT